MTETENEEQDVLTTAPEDDDPHALTGEIVPEDELQFDEDTDVDPEFVELADED